MEEMFVITGYGEGDNAALCSFRGDSIDIIRRFDAGRKPSWCVPNGKELFLTNGTSVRNEGITGTINAFNIANDVIFKTSSVPAGENPSCLALSPDGRFIASANYLSPSTSIISIPTGEKAAEFFYEGHSVVEGRQDTPHPHAVLFHDGILYTADLGLDRVHRVSLRDDGITELEDLKVPAGMGPRALLSEGKKLFVLGELDNALRIFDTVTLAETACFKTTMAECETYAGPMAMHNGLVYIGNRGAETLSVIDPSIGLMKEIPTVEWPRFMAVRDDFLFLLGERCDTVLVLSLPSLQEITRLSFPSPVSMAFI